MKTIVIISGKGGTGKTVVSAGFAALARRKVMVDCDVDAADLHLLLHPQVLEKHVFKKGVTAEIDEGKCTRCGRCREHCRFEAITSDFKIDGLACEGCGFCFHLCPEQAVCLKENVSGQWYISTTRYGPMVHADLFPGEENSGKLVAEVRDVARRLAEEQKLDYVIVDGTPGIGCPVIASLSGADLALVVTEPTLSGIHDLDRVLAVTRHFKIPSRVIINKYDLNEVNTLAIEAAQKNLGFDVLGRIPFSSAVPESVVQAKPVMECGSNKVTEEIQRIWAAVEDLLQISVQQKGPAE